jgi:hypothetical protein
VRDLVLFTTQAAHWGPPGTPHSTLSNSRFCSDVLEISLSKCTTEALRARSEAPSLGISAGQSLVGAMGAGLSRPLIPCEKLKPRAALG